MTRSAPVGLHAHGAEPISGPILTWTDMESAAFDVLLQKVEALGGGDVVYDLAAPKHRFLAYAAEQGGVLLHGTSHGDLATLEPGGQGDLLGRPVRAVFASSDGVWSMFFAILDWRCVAGVFNGCQRIGGPDGDRRGYVFAVYVADGADQPFQAGWVYFLSRRTFHVTLDAQGNESHEWLSEVPAAPMARLKVDPEDFPFLDKVAINVTSD